MATAPDLADEVRRRLQLRAEGGALIHAPSGLRLRLVPGGVLRRAVTSARRERLDAQAHDTSRGEDLDVLLGFVDAWSHREGSAAIAPFLLAEAPVAAAWLDGGSGIAASPGDAMLDADRLERARARLVETGLRLPTADEWQWAASSGDSDRLFPWGDERPDEPRWFESPLGLAGAGDLPELVTVTGRTGDEIELAGGAGVLAPWQDCGEWIAYACAHRSPLRGAPLLALRPALSLEP